MFYTKGNPVAGESISNINGVKNRREAPKKCYEVLGVKIRREAAKFFREVLGIKIRCEAANFFKGVLGVKICREAANNFAFLDQILLMLREKVGFLKIQFTPTE